MNQAKKIVMVLDRVFPPDIRVEKEARALRDAGFCVVILSRPQDGLAAEERWESVRVMRAQLPREDSVAGKMEVVQTLLRFVSPPWQRAIREFALRERPNAIHVHDLPLVNTALAAVRDLSIPVVADLHENYPAAMQEYNRTRRGLRAALYRRLGGYRRWLRHEGQVCRRVDHVVAVVDEMKERMMKQHGLDDRRITVVTNTEEKAFVANNPVAEAVCARHDDGFILLYIGGFGPHRGLDTVVLGMKRLQGRIPSLKLLLVGRGSANFEEKLAALIRTNNLEDTVEMIGWQPFDKVPSYMRAASIGLVPHHSNEHTDHTIPHKLFQYMMTGTPVLVSSCKPLARIVRETGAGLIFRASDPEDFADKVLYLYEHPAERQRLGSNGTEATLSGPWNWERTGDELVGFYQGFFIGNDAVRNPRPLARSEAESVWS